MCQAVKEKVCKSGKMFVESAFLTKSHFWGIFRLPPVALKSLLRLTFFSLKPVAVDLFPGHIATLSKSPAAGYSNKRRDLDPLRRLAGSRDASLHNCKHRRSI